MSRTVHFATPSRALLVVGGAAIAAISDSGGQIDRRLGR
jgi:hypothetical protein